MIGALHGGLLLQSGRLPLQAVQLLAQEPYVILALSVLLHRAPVLDNPANDRHDQCENERGEFDAMLRKPLSHENDSKENPMNNEIQKFDFKGSAVRVIADEAGEPWFVAKDVAEILEYQNGSRDINRHVDEGDREKQMVFDGNQMKETIIINESGLYALILSSKMPAAREFKHWVTSEVLPQIRRTGGYIPLDGTESDAQVMARALKIADRTLADRERTIQAQAKQLEEQRPKVLFADAVAASDGTCLVGELAKMLRQNGVQVGQNRLFARLREDGWLGKSGGNRNVPTQKAMERGLFRIKETAVTHSDGHVTISRTAKVTGAGQRFFIDLYGTGAKPLDGLEARDEAR